MAKDELLSSITRNVLDGRTTKEDRGLSNKLAGQPGVTELIDDAMRGGLSAQEIVKEALIVGMQKVCELYEKGKYYLPDLLIASNTITCAIKGLKQSLLEEGFEPKGKMVIATVEGDIHAIGKDMVALVMQGSGYEIVDLGVNVPSRQIYEAVAEVRPDFLGLSALLTSAMANMQGVIDMLAEAGLRSAVTIMVGGAPLSSRYAREIGADFYARDAFKAMQVADQVIHRTKGEYT